jgi:hypothetical protein
LRRFATLWGCKHAVPRHATLLDCVSTAGPQILRLDPRWDETRWGKMGWDGWISHKHKQNLTRTRWRSINIPYPTHLPVPQPCCAPSRLFTYYSVYTPTPDSPQQRRSNVDGAFPYLIPCTCASRTPQGRRKDRTDGLRVLARRRRVFLGGVEWDVRWRLCEARGER